MPPNDQTTRNTAKLTSNQRDALVSIAGVFPRWLHAPNAWTAANSLIRKGLAKKRPGKAYTENMRFPVAGAEFAVTPNGVAALLGVNAELHARVSATIDSMAGVTDAAK